MPITRKGAKDYFNSSLDVKNTCHATLRLLEENGSLVCLWEKRGLESFESLSGIEVIDGDKLLRAIGIEPKSTVISKAIEIVSYNHTGIEWIDNILVHVVKQWRMAKTGNGFSYKKVDLLLLTIKFAEELETNGVSGRDMRTLSLDIYGHTKILEKNMSALTRIYCDKFPDSCHGWSPQDKLAYLGVSKFPPIIYIRGNVELGFINDEHLTCNIPPFVGVSLDSVKSTKISASVKYVLTIENLTTYQRYVREINDEGVILYTGGFPGKGFQKFLSLLDLSIDETVYFYHWGDIDIAGYQIANIIAEQITIHTLKPFNMHVFDIPGCINNNELIDKIELGKAAKNFQPEIKKAALSIINEHNPVAKMEQEMIKDIESPLST